MHFRSIYSFAKMALFMNNICTYGCKISFPSLKELIMHIETIHIDFNPRVMELKEANHSNVTPMSYVLRYRLSTSKRHESRQNIPLPVPENCENEFPQFEYVIPPEVESETWVSTEYPDDSERKYKKKKYIPTRSSEEKPFVCPIPGCHKRYKNVNGMKYHSKNGHKSFSPEEESRVAELLKDFLQKKTTKPSD